MIPPTYASDALRRLSLGTASGADIHTDALGRAAFRANEDPANFHRIATGPDTSRMSPAAAGRVAGGTPRYKDPTLQARHGQHIAAPIGGNPYAQH